MSRIDRVMQTVMKAAVKLVPAQEADPLIDRHRYIGQPLDRVDGALKVKGEALFAAEHGMANLCHGVLVHSTVAKGRITRIDDSAARTALGVVAIITHENAPKTRQPTLLSIANIGRGVSGSDLPLLHDEKVHYDGEPVAIVVAETLEQAEHAAWLLRVDYETEAAAVSFDALKGQAEEPPDVLGEKREHKVGDAAQAFADSPFGVDQIYRTPRYNQNALELHGSIAFWEADDKLTMFDASQFVNGFKHQLARIFNLRTEDVRIISPFVGGGFGAKWALWPNTALCALAAKVTGRPVKLVLSREGVFRTVGGRTLAEQRVALAAGVDGQFTALLHTGTTATTKHAEYPEQFSLTARHLYRSQTLLAGQKLVYLDTVANAWMRAPGEAIATFALESAIDELAHAMNMDPVELRRINEPQKDPTTDAEFSMRNLLEAYRRGADRFGWHRRSATPGAERDGVWRIGRGVATAYYPYFRWPAKVKVRISADGTAVVQAAAHEMGMGTATVQLQQAADRLGLRIEQLTFEYGDSALPDSPISAGGSSQTVTIAAALLDAVEKLHQELLKLAAKGPQSPLAGARADDVEARQGGLFRKDQLGGETYAAILKSAGRSMIEAEGSTMMATEMMKFSMASYGAQFCELRVHEQTGEVRVTRWLGSFDCGRILNPKTATSQLRGGIVMGIGMALEEETVFDERKGRILSRSLAEYHVPVHLDVPHIDVIFNDVPDKRAPLGARGLAEIGITGAAAAIANAVFNATGRRIRQLPITLDKLM